MRTDAVRAEIARLLRVAPFRPFAIGMENGDRIVIDHPENIAYDPEGGSSDFYVTSGRARLFGTFEAVTNVGTLEAMERAA